MPVNWLCAAFLGREGYFYHLGGFVRDSVLFFLCIQVCVKVRTTDDQQLGVPQSLVCMHELSATDFGVFSRRASGPDNESLRGNEIRLTEWLIVVSLCRRRKCELISRWLNEESKWELTWPAQLAACINWHIGEIMTLKFHSEMQSSAQWGGTLRRFGNVTLVFMMWELVTSKNSQRLDCVMKSPKKCHPHTYCSTRRRVQTPRWQRDLLNPCLAWEASCSDQNVGSKLAHGMPGPYRSVTRDHPRGGTAEAALSWHLMGPWTACCSPSWRVDKHCQGLGDGVKGVTEDKYWFWPESVCIVFPLSI